MIWTIASSSLQSLLLLFLSAANAQNSDELTNPLLVQKGPPHPSSSSVDDEETFVVSTSSPPIDQRSQSILYALTKNFRLVCCMGGVPELSNPKLVRNFTIHSASLLDDRSLGGNDAFGTDLSVQNCRLFQGSFLLPQPSVAGFRSVSGTLELSYTSQVHCKCPELGMGRPLGRDCRRLPACLNNGIHSLLDPNRCFCLEPFFGERCEKVCDQGRRVKGADGRDRCNCAPFYRGEECREAICLNGGRPSEEEIGHCDCPPHFLGFHCEIDANRTSPRHEFISGSSRFHQRFGEQSGEMFSRDVSGTVFSLVMIVVLVLSMYLLMKHRMQVQSRYLNSRRADLLGACNFPASLSHHFQQASGASGSGRRVELLPAGEAAPTRSFPSFARSLAPFLPTAAPAGDGGPPPYAPPGHRVRRVRNEVLPPLPSYEDATKLPALIPSSNGEVAGEDEGAEEVQMAEGSEERIAGNGDEDSCSTRRNDEGRMEEEGSEQRSDGEQKSDDERKDSE